MKYLREFENEAAYSAYTQSEDYVTPNVCYCDNERTVMFNRYPVVPINSFGLSGDSSIGADGTYNYTIDSILPATNDDRIVSLAASVSTPTTGTASVAVNGTTGVVLTIADCPETAENVTLTVVAKLSSDKSVTATKTIELLCINYSKKYMTIISTSDNNTIGWYVAYGSAESKTIKISTDDGQTWNSKTSTKNTTGGTVLATLNTGDKMLIKASNENYGGLSDRWNSFTSTGTFDVEGNIMSMLYEDNFINQTALRSLQYTFGNLFQKTHIVNAENLVLPATQLTKYCYSKMFRECTNLITVPKLPATTLTEGCYSTMFSGCTALTTAPELPATTLAESCYNGMFYGCTSLATAPALPVTNLAESCYSYMFKSCTALTTAPELPATTLIKLSYYYMFSGCINLNNIKCLATDISATDSTKYWVQNVAASGTFVKSATMSSWTTGTDGIPSGWTTQDYAG